MKHLLLVPLICIAAACCPVPEHTGTSHSGDAVLPDSLAGMSLAELREDYRARLFDSYLPFWENGGIDRQYGGFICHLEDDGTPVDGEKNLWFQGRGVWVYSFLYNNLDRNPEYLEIARQAYRFMTEKMYAGNGTWPELVDRDGTVIQEQAESIYGQLFAVNGLAEYYKATGEQRALELALETLDAALKRYESPNYRGVNPPGNAPGMTGLRAQGHSMVIIRLLTQFLRHYQDSELDALAARQVELLTTRFYNPDYGIVNENLDHDYNRLPGYEDRMFTGHSIETSWMLMDEALRLGDRELFDLAAGRFRRFLEMSWDHVYGGLGSGTFSAGGKESQSQNMYFGEKTMWLQCEAMLGCMMVLEYTGAPWAAEWYGRVREFTLNTVADNGIGVWAQATDRQGNLVARAAYHPKRRGNFHQPRYLMLDILSLDRMIANEGRLTPFPAPR